MVSLLVLRRNIKQNHPLLCMCITLNSQVSISTKTVSIKIVCRFGHTERFVTAAKQISPFMLDQQRLFARKAVLHYFCRHFTEHQLSELLTDKFIIAWVDNALSQRPPLHHNIFQVAFQTAYARRQFSQQVVQNYFLPDFPIVDPFGINKGLCDPSTLYSGAALKIVCKFFNLDYKDVSVNSTPLFKINSNEFSSEMQKTVETNKFLTGNACPDILIKERPYDFKESDQMYYVKNHIYFVDSHVFAHQSILYLKNVESSLINQLRTLDISEGASRAYVQDMLFLINSRRLQSAQNTLEVLYNHLLKTTPPPKVKLAFIIPVKKASYADFEQHVTPKMKQEIENIPLEKGHITDVRVKKAIYGILDGLNNQTKQNIQEATHKSLSFALKIQEEVD